MILCSEPWKNGGIQGSRITVEKIISKIGFLERKDLICTEDIIFCQQYVLTLGILLCVNPYCVAISISTEYILLVLGEAS